MKENMRKMVEMIGKLSHRSATYVGAPQLLNIQTMCVKWFR